MRIIIPSEALSNIDLFNLYETMKAAYAEAPNYITARALEQLGLECSNRAERLGFTPMAVIDIVSR